MSTDQNVPSPTTVRFLDTVEKFPVVATDFQNELGSLHTLLAGIKRLNGFIKNHEHARTPPPGVNIRVYEMGATSDEEAEFLELVACMFHWFGISVCNYARLVGYIRGMSIGHFSRADLKDSSKFKQVKSSIDAYANSIPELEHVRIWRNKVFAHYAITDPRKDDNIATLDMSVISPVAYDGRYAVGTLTMRRSGPSGIHLSGLPRWSITEVFEALEPRFWPGLVFQPGPPNQQPPSESSEDSVKPE